MNYININNYGLKESLESVKHWIHLWTNDTPGEIIDYMKYLILMSNCYYGI